MHRGIATFTLDFGQCPKWLFERMVKLGRGIAEVLVAEYGPDEFIRRLGDPVWFQSLGTVLAFDWNASGLTTILTAALKEALRGKERSFGIFICGGKGKTSLKTPDEIVHWGERLSLPDPYVKQLVYNSKMSAKVDASLIQDDFQIYHHAFFFSKNGAWTVVQQGMNTRKKTARRYHWHSAQVHDFIEEPHSGIISDWLRRIPTLNMTSKNSAGNRSLSIELIRSNYATVMKDIELLRKHSSALSRMVSVRVRDEAGCRLKTCDGSVESCNGRGENRRSPEQLTLLELAPREFGPSDHPVFYENFSKSRYLEKILWKLCDEKPGSYERMLATEGVGPKTIRALSLVSEIIYGAKPSYEDPARYSFAHGGKDGSPFPVDRTTYDKSISILRKAIHKARLSPLEKGKMLKKLG